MQSEPKQQQMGLYKGYAKQDCGHYWHMFQSFVQMIAITANTFHSCVSDDGVFIMSMLRFKNDQGSSISTAS